MSDDSLNQFGDTVIETTGDHGSDISSQRIDGLDEAALRYALNLRGTDSSAIDIGGGLGSQGFRFSTFGINTTVIDQLDLHDWITQLDDLFEIGSLDFLQTDVRDLTHSDLPDNLQLIYSQRFIHYLTWDEAYELLTLLSEHIQGGGQIFISASGLNTELGEGYPDRDKDVENRFSPLSEHMAEKHGIYPDVCLYDENDMNRLLTETGFDVLSISTAGFGNIKAVAEKPNNSS